MVLLMNFPWMLICIIGWSFRFLEEEYIDYCVPSNVSSGLGSLPLSYVWYKGKENRSWPTDPTLPTGEKLNGAYAYSLIMPYFTTNDMKPSTVHALGKKQLDKLYPMVSQLLPLSLNLIKHAVCNKMSWRICGEIFFVRENILRCKTGKRTSQEWSGNRKTEALAFSW